MLLVLSSRRGLPNQGILCRVSKFRSALFFSACCSLRLKIYAQSDCATTAWHNGKFNLDAAGVVGRSDIVLQVPNRQAREAMPLGNGRLGIAVWFANSLTAQLNRADTLPGRPPAIFRSST